MTEKRSEVSMIENDIRRLMELMEGRRLGKLSPNQVIELQLLATNLAPKLINELDAVKHERDWLLVENEHLRANSRRVFTVDGKRWEVVATGEEYERQ
jgi:hypothetical protein